MGPLYSIGRKFIMAVTGIFLILFLIEHLVSNLLLLAGDQGQMYNAYAHFMATNGFIRAAEIVLFAGFLFHIIDGIYLGFRNRNARPKGYYKKEASSSFFSRTMIYTGIIILIFLVIHLADFFVKAKISAELPMDAAGNPDLFYAAQQSFSQTWYVAVYVISMIILGFHLTHGFYSSFQTVGWRHRNYFKAVQYTGYALAVLLAAGFAIIPLVFYFKSF